MGGLQHLAVHLGAVHRVELEHLPHGPVVQPVRRVDRGLLGVAAGLVQAVSEERQAMAAAAAPPAPAAAEGI